MPGVFSLDTVTNEFYAAALNYSNIIRPYALKLFFGLLLIELLVTFIQYTADGALDPISYFGRMIRQLMGAGFILAMLTYGFLWMMLVIQSFGRLGAILTGLPTLSPESILIAGENLALTLWNSPVSSGIVSAFELALVEGLLAGIVFGAFAWVAVELLLTIARAFLMIGVGVILLSFGANRFTSNASEGYFSTVMRQGVKILFMYAVLAIGMDIVTHLEADLMAACKPAAAALPWMTTYFVPPTAIMSTVCTGTISLADMLNYVAMALVFASCVVGIPRMAADMVGGPLGHALEDLAAIYYLGRNIASPVVGAASKAASGVVTGAATGASETYRRSHPSQPAMQSFAAEVAAQARARSAAAGTTPLNPFNGHTPGYNMRPPAGPSLPPAPGSGGAALEYQPLPGKVGTHTRDIAVDVSDLQNDTGGKKNG
jgi:type IV secretion system protein TrbL